MNVFDLGAAYVPFDDNGSTPAFQATGFITIEVPSEHLDVTQTLGGGTLALEHSTDHGENWRTYTDTLDNAATLSVLDKILPVDIAGTIMARLTLTGSTTPVLPCIRVNAERRLVALA